MDNREKLSIQRKLSNIDYDVSLDTISKMSPEDIKQLIYDLQVHKLELEMQNDELRHAQLELEDSRNRYYNLFDFAPVSYFTLDARGVITELNLAASKLLGVERRYLINKSIFEFIASDCNSYFTNFINNVIETNVKQVAEFKFINKSGLVVYAQVESVAIANGFDEVSSCRMAVMDVTKRKQTEEALKESQRFIQSISEATPSIIYLYDIVEQKIVYTNRAFDTIIGYDQNEIEESMNDFLASLYHPEDFQKWQDRIQRFKSMHDKEIVESEFRWKNASGEWNWLHGKEVLFKRDENGNPKVILGIALDISELKNIEYKLIEKNEELQKTNADLDRFVYSASHDLKAPLNSVTGLIQVAKMEVKDKAANKYLDLMQTSIKKLDNFVQDLISFSRNTRLAVENQEIDFQDIIDDIFDGLRFFEGSEKVEKIVNIHTEGNFYSDRTRLHIILSNLISNAIRYHNYSREEPYIAINVKAEKQKAVIEVRDNGQGIGEEHLEKIFDIFYRASLAKSGSGLGLFIVKEAINKLNGTIAVKSVINQGSCFIIELPNKEI